MPDYLVCGSAGENEGLISCRDGAAHRARPLAVDVAANVGPKRFDKPIVLWLSSMPRSNSRSFQNDSGTNRPESISLIFRALIRKFCPRHRISGASRK